MEDLDAEEGNAVGQRLFTTGESTTNVPFIDSHSDLDLNNWDCSWLNSLTDDGLLSGDLVFGFFA
ncbi:hypothetical protein N7488_011631 [Penicillium malachiteum]|nr:hypothetical protein N7488_011631 [Penicillium malachiteum]